MFTHSVAKLAIEYTAGLADLRALDLMAFPLLDLLPLLAGARLLELELETLEGAPFLQI